MEGPPEDDEHHKVVFQTSITMYSRLADEALDNLFGWYVRSTAKLCVRKECNE